MNEGFGKYYSAAETTDAGGTALLEGPTLEDLVKLTGLSKVRLEELLYDKKPKDVFSD